ncbi:MAG: translocation/assembly module TamB domain-containing protein [Leptolyngbyaceae cyanobacterium bins.59]|nr:translocation/assembly module TamB domain-containing protein [Leptolyngbyaceae cyanobacterium bins.59]
MTSPQNSGDPSGPRRSRLRSLLFSRTTLILVSVLLLGGGAALWWAWFFVHEQLVPLVQDGLTKSLKRPVKLGRVERFSLTRLRLGPSSLPATPTDPDSMVIQAIEVDYNPWRVLLTRRLHLSLTAIQPYIYVEQDKKGVWISPLAETEEEEGLITTEIEAVRVQGGAVDLVPNPPVGKPKVPVSLSQLSGVARFLGEEDQGQRIRLDFAGQFAKDGKVKITGETVPETAQADLRVTGENLPVLDVGRLLPLPIDLQAGRANANFRAKLVGSEIPSLFGTIDANKVTLRLPGVPQQLANATGRLRFQDKVVVLETIDLLFGRIPVQAKGTLDLRGPLNLTAAVRPTSIPLMLQTLGVKLPVPIAGLAQANLQIKGTTQSPAISGVVTSNQRVRVDRVDLNAFRARFELLRSVLFLPDIQATPTVGGQVRAEGRILLSAQRLGFGFTATDVPADAIAQSYAGKLPITLGPITSNGQIFGTFARPQIRARWQAPSATYPASGTILVAGTDVLLENAIVAVGGGTVTAQGRVTNGQLQGTIQASRIAVNRFVSAVPGILSGTATVSGNTRNLSANTLRGEGRFRVDTPGGVVLARGTVQEGQLQATVQGNQIRLSPFVQGVPGTVTGTVNLRGAVANLNPNAVQGTGRLRLDVAGGTVFALGNLRNGRLQATLQGSQVELNRIASGIRGTVGGTFNVAANINNLSPGAILASGRLNFPRGLVVQNIPLARRDLTAQVQWDGEKVRLQDVQAPGLRASGLIFARLEGPGAPEITNVDLNINARNYNLGDLAFALPSGIRVAGTADFQGRVRGPLQSLTAVGTLGLNRFAINDVAFEPRLVGPIRATGTQTVDLRLQGQQDRIFVALEQNRPRSFDIRRGEATAIGRPQGDGLAVSIRQFPIALLNVAPIPNLGTVSGTFSGDLAVNLDRQTAQGTVDILRPRLGLLEGDRFAGRIRYANGTLNLTDGDFEIFPDPRRKRGGSRYRISGNFSPGNDPQGDIKLQIVRGQLADVAQVIEILGLDTLLLGQDPPNARAGDLALQGVGEAERSLLTQIRRYSEIATLLQQQRDQRQSPVIPNNFADLEGSFSGEVTASGSLRRGFTADFDLQGQNWQWGRYGAERVVAKGRFDRGNLTLIPLTFETGETLVGFTGQVGTQTQSGQIEVRNLSLEDVQEVIALPIDVTGRLNGNATIAGNLADPRAVGELRLVDGTLNGEPVKAARAGFSYNQFRLSFGSTVDVQGPEPVTVTGSFPLPLQGENDRIELNAKVSNEGLALLNLLNRQVSWEGGKGSVDLRVAGTLQNPIATGTATIRDATFKIQALPEPLTDVDADAVFNVDRIEVSNLDGEFSRGKVVAKGVLPLSDALSETDPDRNNLLAVTLDNLALNLKGLYRGRVDGNVTVLGSALRPRLGGSITLQSGQVLLPDEVAARTPAVAEVVAGENVFEPPRFDNLRLVLGDRILITRQPLLSFLAAGELIITGTLDDPLADGTIRLRGGQLNIFTTQFTLAGGFEHTAQFTPRQGLDPVLNIRLITSVPEITRSRVPTRSSFFSISDVEDVPATGIGSLQTVRIQARVSGPASQIFDTLELTSSPSRTRTEIIALLGGGFVSTLGRGDDSLALANLAGSAFLSQIQTAIGNAIGLSEFRLFPTVITSRDARTTRASSSTLGLAAEVGVDITNNLSASILKELTTDQNPQFGLRYRVNDQILLRGSTDFSGDSRGVVEYETRF